MAQKNFGLNASPRGNGVNGPYAVALEATRSVHPSIGCQAQRMLRLQNRKGLFVATSAIVLLTSIILIGAYHRTTHHSVSLSWHSAVPKPGVTVVGYNIYRSVNSGGPYVRLASGVTGLRYRDWMINNARSYYYVVSSVDAAGHESPYSTEIEADIP